MRFICTDRIQDKIHRIRWNITSHPNFCAIAQIAHQVLALRVLRTPQGARENRKRQNIPLSFSLPPPPLLRGEEFLYTAVREIEGVNNDPCSIACLLLEGRLVSRDVVEGELVGVMQLDMHFETKQHPNRSVLAPQDQSRTGSRRGCGSLPVLRTHVKMRPGFKHNASSTSPLDVSHFLFYKHDTKSGI